MYMSWELWKIYKFRNIGAIIIPVELVETVGGEGGFSNITQIIPWM